MGEAKKRGTREQRMHDAMDGLGDDLRHFGFVWDDSPIGEEALRVFLEKGPDHFRNTLAPKVDRLKEAEPRYIAFLGSIIHSGGMTIAAPDDATLLDDVLPTMMKRVLENGGFCGFAVATSVDRRLMIESRLAELQPSWNNGTYEVPALLRERLADLDRRQHLLGPPMHGGTVIAYQDVVFEAPATDSLLDAIAAVRHAWVEAGDASMGLSATGSPHTEVLKDETLIVAFLLPAGMREVPIAPAYWKPRGIESLEGVETVPGALLNTQPLHGGRWLEDVHIMESTPGAAAYLAAMREAILDWSRRNKLGLDDLIRRDRAICVHEAMPDGSLRITIFRPDGERFVFDFGQGEWAVPAKH